MNNSSGKNKYAFVGKSGFETKMVKGQGYWVYANESGNLTLPSAGGSLGNETYKLSDLMFRNSSGSELNVTDAGIYGAGWFNEETDIYYWNPTGGPSGNGAFVHVDLEEDSLNPWQGYFIYGLKDDIKVLRQN